MGISTHTVEIVPVMLEKHPDADKLSIVKVYGFTVVVNTADWQGVTQAAYVQPDSVMPDTSEYRFLKETSNLRKEKDTIKAEVGANVITPDEALLRFAAVEEKINKNTKYLRITVRRLRGVISMGMLLPCPEGAHIGDDVAERLGITHYDPPAEEEIEARRKHTGEDVAPPPPMVYAPKYDIESAYRYLEAFEPGEPVYVTEKIDGQNARFVAIRAQNEEGTDVLQMHAGSRTEWKKAEGASNWWRVLDQTSWIKAWCFGNPGKVLYGEIFGYVQALRYGTQPGQLLFRGFDVLEGTEYMDVDNLRAYLPIDQQHVPVLGTMPFNFEELKKLADGPSLIPGAKHMREGIVIRPLHERKHWKLGRVILKLVSNSYLEKSAR